MLCTVQQRSVAGKLVYTLNAANPGLSRDEKIRECTLVKVVHLPQLVDNYFLNHKNHLLVSSDAF
jgi:hypothetical protein